jgi:cytidyltransferase-like protein
MLVKKVFISGCYDILHAGHIQFFKEAKSLGDYLIVCFAGDKVLAKHKRKKPSIPELHKKILLESIEIVDEVVIGEDESELGLDFIQHFINLKPDILAVTEDDKYKQKKINLCLKTNSEYIVLPKTDVGTESISTSSILRRIKAPNNAPLRVDFGGGWLDVPKFKKEGGFIVNCSITPFVSLHEWNYEKKSGLGGSGAWAILNGFSGVDSELELGCGWQDPAVIIETGLCSWKSGDSPVLEIKIDPSILNGLMALLYTGESHDTPGNANIVRDYDLIYKAGKLANKALYKKDLNILFEAINLSYKAQIKEGMKELKDFHKTVAKKYCGGGWGGYALYVFLNQSDRDEFVNLTKGAIAIEPYIKSVK